MLHWCSALVWAGKGSFCFIWGQFTFLVQQFPSDMCLSAERVDIVCVPFESRRRKKFCIVSRQKAIAWVPSVPETNCWTDKKLLLFQNFNFRPLSRLSIIVHKYQKSYQTVDHLEEVCQSPILVGYSGMTIPFSEVTGCQAECFNPEMSPQQQKNIF